MRQLFPHRIRGILIAALASAAIVTSGGSALGAHQLSHTGAPGAWSVPDSPADPAAGCSYDGGGVAGGTYLTGIRLRNDVTLRGTGPALRSVGFRPIIQHKVDGVWTTVKKGTLITGNATASAPVVLSGGITPVPVSVQPKRSFRLVLKLIWYTATASVKGTRVILVDRYVPRDGGVATRCPGFVSDF